MKKVTKQEFDQFIIDYPGKLTRDCITIGEPPIMCYRDEEIPSDGKLGDIGYYFDKVVARISMDWLGPKGETDKENTKEYWKYSIKEASY